MPVNPIMPSVRPKIEGGRDPETGKTMRRYESLQVMEQMMNDHVEWLKWLNEMEISESPGTDRWTHIQTLKLKSEYILNKTADRIK